MPFIVPGRSYPRRPDSPLIVNRDSSLSNGLVRWTTVDRNTLWVKDYGSDKTTNTSASRPAIVGNPLGGLNWLTTGGTTMNMPPTPTFPGFSSIYTFRIVFTAISWPGAFTPLFDDTSRKITAFFNTSGVLSANGSWINGSSYGAFTAGVRWDLVVTNHNTGVSASTDIWVNGNVKGSGGSGFDGASVATDLNFGANPSGGGTASNISYESVQFWNRELEAGEIYSMWNPPTRWQLYWQSSRRLFFDMAASAGYLLVKN